MPQTKLTIALSHYDRHLPFFEGRVMPEGIDLTVLEVGQSVPSRHGTNRHERMIQEKEFDICELSLSSYLMAKSRGMPFTAIPVFPRRLFSQSQIWVNSDAGIKYPEDLIGRRVGLNTFQTTVSVLAKGDLQSEYRVPWREIQWVVSKAETISFEPQNGVNIAAVPLGKKIGALLEQGEIDALIMPEPPQEVARGSVKIRRFFSDPKQEEIRYFQKNGFYPIMHVVAFKDEVLKRDPTIARNIMAAFEQAKEVCADYYQDPNWSSLAWGRHLFEEEKRILGDDSWSYGVKRNRANLERFLGYSLDQGLVQKQITVEELFAETTIDT